MLKNRLQFVSAVLLLIFAAPGTEAQQMRFPFKTIREINQVPLDSLLRNNDNSRFNGDTVRVAGIAITAPGEAFTGAGTVAFYLQDIKGGPWSGILIRQADATDPTGISGVQLGDSVAVLGFIDEFANSTLSPSSSTQLNVLNSSFQDPDRIGVLQIISGSNPIPAPVLLTADSLSTFAKSEKWEGIFIRLNNMTVVNPGLPSNQMSAQDNSGIVILDDHLDGMFQYLNGQPAGQKWQPFSTGAKFNLKQALVRGYFLQNLPVSVNPRNINDLQALTNPPVISNVRRLKNFVRSSDVVPIEAKILVPGGGTVRQAKLSYSVNGAGYKTLNMTSPDSIFATSIPAQANGVYVKYFVQAQNAFGDSTLVPPDTTIGMFFYLVRDGATTIKDLQWTPFGYGTASATGPSSYEGIEVTVSALVTTSTNPYHFAGSYFIQSNAAPWEGILVADNVNKPNIGDSVTVTATVREANGVTRLATVTNFINRGPKRTLSPLRIRTGNLRTTSAAAESYESVLIKFDNVVISNQKPDPERAVNRSRFGEYEINDGSGGVRMDDDSAIIRWGDELPYVFAAGDSIKSVTGIGWYSFSNHKIEPRDSTLDLIGIKKIGTRVNEQRQLTPTTFELSQNYPNPLWSAAALRLAGNPGTTIRYQLAKSGPVELSIYNTLGQKVRTLISGDHAAGNYFRLWDGRDDQGRVVTSGVYLYQLTAGSFRQVKKLVLMR
jgi:hypothetical protein